MESKAKILVVEDNPANVELFQDILEMAGYAFVHTVKGEDALEIAKKEKPDLVLMDIQLPGMDGMAATKILKSHDDTKNIKIIALTAHAMKGDKEMFLDQGFDGYMAKPIVIKEFLEAIEGYLSVSK